MRGLGSHPIRGVRGAILRESTHTAKFSRDYPGSGRDFQFHVTFYHRSKSRFLGLILGVLQILNSFLVCYLLLIKIHRSNFKGHASVGRSRICGKRRHEIEIFQNRHFGKFSRITYFQIGIRQSISNSRINQMTAKERTNLLKKMKSHCKWSSLDLVPGG